MILKSIKLRNIRSYLSQEIAFPQGSILLAGDIGSGKSSVLHSIEFALFGARRDSISGEALLRKGEKDGEVELCFELEGKEVRITRRLRKVQDSVAQDAGFLIIDGKKVDCTSTELKARILSMLGYPKELLSRSNSLVYRYTVYTPQEDMKRILFDSDDDRIDTLRKVFGIDRYKRIAENALIYVRKLKESKKELQGIMSGLDEKEKELAARKDELAKLVREAEQLSPLIGIAREALLKKKECIAKIENDIQLLNDLKRKREVNEARLMEIVRQRSHNTSEIALLDEDILRLKRKLEQAFLEERSFPPIEDIEASIAAGEAEVTRISSIYMELKERSRQILDRISGLKKDVDAKSSRMTTSAEKDILYRQLLEDIKDKGIIEKSLAEMTNRQKGAERIIVELETNLKRSEHLKVHISTLEHCPTCMQEVGAVHKQSIITEEERKIAKIKSELSGLVSDKENVARMIDELNKKTAVLVEKERVLAGVKVELSNMNALSLELSSIIKLVAGLEKEKENILHSLEKIDEKMIDSHRKDIAEKRMLIKDIHEYNMLVKERKHNLELIAKNDDRKTKLLQQQSGLADEVKRINASSLSIHDDVVKLGPVEETFRKEKEILDMLSDEEKVLEVRLGEKNKEIEGVSRFVCLLAKDVDAKKKSAADYAYLSSVQEWIEIMFVNLMSIIERQVMARVHTQFSELFRGWFEMLVEDKNMSIRIDDSFTPIITQNGYDVDIGYLSGGEKTSIALAYRLALNKVINGMISGIKTKDLIILDEPTDGFSSEQLDKVRDVLEELDTRQTLIVSHEAKIESFVDHVIRINKSEHVSKVVS